MKAASPRYNAALTLLALAAIGVAPACILLSSSETTQCSADADCADLGEDAVCDLDASVCISRIQTATTSSSSSSGSTVTSTSSGQQTGCVSNQQCIDDNAGQPSICREVGGECVSLLSDTCTRIFPEDISLVANDDVIIFGHMAEYSGDGGELAQIGGNAVLLAAEEFAEVGVGLPIGGTRRPVVFVTCDASEGGAKDAAEHLINDVGVPAIIGPETAQAYQLALTTTIPSGTLLLLPGETSAEYDAPFPDEGLVWHLNPSDAEIGKSYASFVPVLEAKLREVETLTTDLRLAVIARSDVTNQAIAEIFYDIATYNDEPADVNEKAGLYERFDYDPDNADFEGLVADIRDYAPHVILVLSTSAEEVVNEILAPSEDEWTAAHRPYWIMTPAVRGESGATHLLEDFVSADDDFFLEDRIFGARWYLPADDELWDKYRLRYDARFDGAFGGYGLGPENYDAAYLLTYATLAAGQSPTLTGKAIAAGFEKLVGPGAVIGAGRTNINAAFSALAAGAAIDFEGTLSSYDYNLLTGLAPRRAVIYCMIEGSFIDTKYFLDPDGTFSGEFGYCDKWPDPEK